MAMQTTRTVTAQRRGSREDVFSALLPAGVLRRLPERERREYFRINTGLWQGDTAVNTEANLALALENYGASVDYSFVWGQGHTMAERSGDATSNFIAWVNSCV